MLLETAWIFVWFYEEALNEIANYIKDGLFRLSFYVSFLFRYYVLNSIMRFMHIFYYHFTYYLGIDYRNKIFPRYYCDGIDITNYIHAYCTKDETVEELNKLVNKYFSKKITCMVVYESNKSYFVNLDEKTINGDHILFNNLWLNMD